MIFSIGVFAVKSRCIGIFYLHSRKIVKEQVLDALNHLRLAPFHASALKDEVAERDAVRRSSITEGHQFNREIFKEHFTVFPLHDAHGKIIDALQSHRKVQIEFFALMEAVFSADVNLKRIRQLCTHVFFSDADINTHFFRKRLVNAEFSTEGFKVTETEADIFLHVIAEVALHTLKRGNSVLSFIIPIWNFQIAKLCRNKRGSGIDGNLIGKLDVASLRTQNKDAFNQISLEAGFDKGVDRQQFRIHLFQGRFDFLFLCTKIEKSSYGNDQQNAHYNKIGYLSPLFQRAYHHKSFHSSLITPKRGLNVYKDCWSD